MRYEHEIELPPTAHALGVASALHGRWTLERVWARVMQRVLHPHVLPHGPQSSVCRARGPSDYERELDFGGTILRDHVHCVAPHKAVFTPQAHGDLAPIRLTVVLSERDAGGGGVRLRFVYESIAAQSEDESRFNGVRQRAWQMVDQDWVDWMLRDDAGHGA